MDVTYFENQRYFSKKSLQGKNVGKENFWELSLLSLLLEQPPNWLPNLAVSLEQLLNQSSYPLERRPNLLHNPIVSLDQLLNQHSHLLKQPKHLLNQPMFETDKLEQPNPAEPGVSTIKTDSRLGRDSLQQPQFCVYSRRCNPRIVETKMDQ